MGVAISSRSVQSRPPAKLSSFNRHVRYDNGPVFQIEHNIDNTKLIVFAIKVERGWFYCCFTESATQLPPICFGLQSDSCSPPTQHLDLIIHFYANSLDKYQLRDHGLMPVELAFKGAQGPVGASFSHFLSVKFPFEQLGSQFRWIKGVRGSSDWTDPLLMLPVTPAEASAFQTGGCCRVMASLMVQAAHDKSGAPYWLHSSNRCCSFSWANAPAPTASDSVLNETAQVDLRGSSACLIRDNALELVVSIQSSQAHILNSIFEELPIECAFVILMEIHPPNQSDPFLVWRPHNGGKSRQIVFPFLAEPIKRVHGSFVAFLTDQPEDELLIFEDGFFINLKVSSWKTIRDGLCGGNTFSVPLHFSSRNNTANLVMLVNGEDAPKDVVVKFKFN